MESNRKFTGETQTTLCCDVTDICFLTGCFVTTAFFIFSEAVKKQEDIELKEQRETIDEVVETKTRTSSVTTVTHTVCNPVIRRSSVSSYGGSVFPTAPGKYHYTAS
jgi:hypothetical protein